MKKIILLFCLFNLSCETKKESCKNLNKKLDKDDFSYCFCYPKVCNPSTYKPKDWL